MKIIIEHVHQEPFHSVTRQDVATVLKIIPADWVGPAHVFLISGQKLESTVHDRPVLLNGVTFRIMSRGQNKSAVIKALLLELAAQATRTFPRKFHRFDKVQLRKLEETIAPYYLRLLAAMGPVATPSRRG
ncbi:hypothetical protein [Hymenobacter edaphi]|uniref:Uncharacterized protein n=1 Tax=Hymenobacter edaphi TaxID=2211146 RepID=A0A328BC39_9BACT|nr:hypothetical protein [Hymenobacter edaphi]RAK64567.1 hypothetical protein DLM85_17900 [Hymenobacter edaphi]